MVQAKRGSKVQVHYTGRLGDGTVFDSSQGRGPLEFEIGDSLLLPDFEKAVIGMEPGEAKTIRIRAARAYGLYDRELVMHLPTKNMPDDLDLKVDDEFQVRRTDGELVNVVVTAISDDAVTVDANHPLAGHDLTFDIRLVHVS